MNEPNDLPVDIDVHAVRRLLESQSEMVLLDCRTPDAQSAARIEGAMLIPIDEIASRLSELELFRERHIVVHCHLGGRSAQVVEWLRSQDFPRVQNMVGGIDAWSVEIDPAVPRY